MMTNNEERQLQKGDRIRCKDANDAVDVAIELGKEGYLWDFAYKHGLLWTKYYVVIEGRDSGFNKTEKDNT